MNRQRKVVISAWVPESIAEAIRTKAFLERRSKSDLVRALLLREFSQEATSGDFDAGLRAREHPR